MFPDGSFSSKHVGSTWNSVSRDGNGDAAKITSITETNYPDKSETIQRVDGVLVESSGDGSSVIAHHIGGTSIHTTNECIKIDDNDSSFVSFESNGRQTVSFNDKCSIFREYIGGKTQKITIERVK